MQPTGDGQNLMAFLLDAANRRLIKGEMIGAGVLLEEVLRIAPENVVARLSLAKLRLRDSPSAASLLAQRVVEAAPNDAEGWSVLGQALSALSRGDEAIQAFRQAARLTPDDAHAQSNLSVALSRAGDPHGAVAAAPRPTSLPPPRAEAHAKLSPSYNILERSEDWAIVASRKQPPDGGTVRS